jgi:hypothetical protein
VLEARPADLADDELGVLQLRRRDDVQYRLYAILGGLGVTLQIELHERRASVRRDLRIPPRIERRAHVLDLWERANPLDHVRKSRSKRRVRNGRRLALNQHQLVRGLFEPGSRERGLRAPGLAADGVGICEKHGAGDLTERKRDDDEGEPAEDGRLPVSGAPAPHTGGEVLRRVDAGHGSSFLSRRFGRWRADTPARAVVGWA